MSEPWLDDPLGYLIGAGRAGDFFARIYESEALVVHHEQPKRFDGLITIDAVDRLVTSIDLREGQLDLADASRRLMRSDYMDAAGYVDRGAVADHHRAGATIILQQAHQLDPSLGRFCRALEHIFSAHVQTNLYLTPPNAQGFKTHYDNHCVLVLQIAGEKAWRLYEKPVDTPFRGEAFELGKYEPGELKQEFVLKAGDCAYVPRGLMHDAMTSGTEPSLHVTVGLITRTWADLMLEAVSEVALRTPALRKSLPAGYARADLDRDAARAALRTLAETVAREVKLDPALDLLADNFIRSRAADNRFAVRDAAKPVASTDKFRAQPHTPHRIAEDGEKLVLIAPGGDLDFPAERRATLEQALSGAPFTPADLKCENAEALTARLLSYGLIVRA
ncbi:MAG TPA: cupin domain-containing protein [Candidatus Binatia bacterium]|nr:cupin domain-containing protein [Candidatus Binatia bacterium]